MSNELSKQTSSIQDVLKGEKMLAAIAEVVPQHMTPERMVKVALMAINKTPKLAECSRDSLLSALMDCSSLGLEPDGRRCHLIPYGNTCQLIIDYKGLIELAKRSGEVVSWKAESVKEKDKFSWINGVIHHEAEFREDRGNLQCVYSVVTLTGGDIDTEVMTLEEVKAIQARSKAGKSGPWITDFDEMAKKTVIRRHSKRLTLSPEFHDALSKDADQLSEIRNVTPKPDNSVNPFAQIGTGEGEAV